MLGFFIYTLIYIFAARFRFSPDNTPNVYSVGAYLFYNIGYLSDLKAYRLLTRYRFEKQ